MTESGHPDTGRGGDYLVRLVAFRDRDRIWRHADSTGFNKVGYVTRQDTVIHPFWHNGLTETPLNKIKARPHTILGLTIPTPQDLKNVEVFFTQNFKSIELFNAGLYCLTQTSDLSFFQNPIKLPLLPPISQKVFEDRWLKLRSILRPADMIAVFEPDSLLSRLIARFDHGTWSHVGLYSNTGTIIEAAIPQVVERDMEVYHDIRYRLGVYRIRGLDGQAASSMIRFMRSTVGSGYSYRKAARLAFFKLLGIGPTGPPTAPRNGSPNDIARSDRMILIYVV